jgi:hypothetical protein
MRSDVASVFYRALALSSVLAAVPLALLWFLDRRERENPWLFAAAFLWGGFIAIALAMPFNTAFFALVDAWVTRHPTVSGVLGPEAAMLLAGPISVPIAEEIAKAMGVLLIFWLLRLQFDNMPTASSAVRWSASSSADARPPSTQGYAGMAWRPMALGSGADTRYSGWGTALFTGIFGSFLGIAICIGDGFVSWRRSRGSSWLSRPTCSTMRCRCSAHSQAPRPGSRRRGTSRRLMSDFSTPS